MTAVKSTFTARNRAEPPASIDDVRQHVETMEHTESEQNRIVTLFSAYYPSHGGGMELACLELSCGLRASGMQVEWVSQDDSEPTDQREASRTPLPGTDLIYTLTGIPMPLPMPWALPSIVRVTKRAGCVVIVEANFVLSVIAFVMAKLLRKPILLIQHVGQPSTVSALASAVMRIGEALATRPMVRTADIVVFVSPVVARYFEDERTRAKPHTIGHGVDMETFRFPVSAIERVADRGKLCLPETGKLACFVGRLTVSKGIFVIAELARRRPDWTFAIAGCGPVDPADWGLPNVVALGQLDRPGVARLYRASDVAVLPSKSESFSLVVREALASGTRVLCSNQIIDTDERLAPALVTEQVDLSDISATAVRFAAALEREPDMSREAAREYVAIHCSWFATNARYIRLIEDQLRLTRGAVT